MTLVERFKNGDIAVQCDTEEKASNFVSWCFENGIEWFEGEPSETCYNKYGDSTCYDCTDGELQFSSKTYYMHFTCRWICTYDEFMKEVESMKEFTLNDLEAGKHVIETRYGIKYLVCSTDKGLFGVGNSGCIGLNDFEQNMKFEKNHNFDIAKVYKIKQCCYFDGILDNARLILVWEREEVKELTMADIEKLVGCKVKIVKEEN